MTARDDYRRALRAIMIELTAKSPAADAEVPVHRRLAAVTAAAITLIRGAEYADVMVIADGQFQSVAATNPLVTDLDAVQIRHQDGPCLQAATSDAVIRSSDLQTERRWPDFTAAALAAGVRSAVTFQLYTHRHGTGALNVFSRAAGAFSLDDEAIGAMLATHAASILIAADIDNHPMDSVLADRDVIGQAKGILMERFVIDSATAHDMLIAQAQDTDTTVHAVARHVIGSV